MMELIIRSKKNVNNSKGLKTTLEHIARMTGTAPTLDKVIILRGMVLTWEATILKNDYKKQILDTSSIVLTVLCHAGWITWTKQK